MGETDLISRQAAIDAVGEEPVVWSGYDEYAQGLNNQWHYDVNALKAVPSAQPEIIHCRDCKYYTPVTARCEVRGKGLYLIRNMEDFCSRAEPYKGE